MSPPTVASWQRMLGGLLSRGNSPAACVHSSVPRLGPSGVAGTREGGKDALQEVQQFAGAANGNRKRKTCGDIKIIQIFQDTLRLTPTASPATGLCLHSTLRPTPHRQGITNKRAVRTGPRSPTRRISPRPDFAFGRLQEQGSTYQNFPDVSFSFQQPLMQNYL